MASNPELVDLLTLMLDIGFAVGFTLGAAVVGIGWAVWGRDAN